MTRRRSRRGRDGDINYTVGDNWGSGFVGNIKVPGGTSGLHGWTLEFDATFDISNIWGAEIVSHVGNHYVIRNAAWTADVAGRRPGELRLRGQARLGRHHGHAASP